MKAEMKAPALTELLLTQTVKFSQYCRCQVSSPHLSPVVVQEQQERLEEAVLLQSVRVCIVELQLSLTTKRARMMKTGSVKILQSLRIC